MRACGIYAEVAVDPNLTSMVSYVAADFKIIVDAYAGVAGGCFLVPVSYAVDHTDGAPINLPIAVIDEGVHGVLCVLVLDAAQIQIRT